MYSYQSHAVILGPSHADVIEFTLHRGEDMTHNVSTRVGGGWHDERLSIWCAYRPQKQSSTSVSCMLKCCRWTCCSAGVSHVSIDCWSSSHSESQHSTYNASRCASASVRCGAAFTLIRGNERRPVKVREICENDMYMFNPRNDVCKRHETPTIGQSAPSGSTTRKVLAIVIGYNV